MNQSAGETTAGATGNLRSSVAAFVTRGDTASSVFAALLALTPLIFVAASWQPSGARGFFWTLTLHFSLPVTAIEVAVIVHAFSSGFSSASYLDRMPPWARMALTGLVMTAVLTAALAAQPARSALRTLQLLVHLLFGLSAGYLLAGRWSHLRAQIWAWMLAGCCLYVAAVIAWVAVVDDAPNFNWLTFGLGVTHIRQTGFYSAGGFGAAIGLAALARTRTGYGLAVAAATALMALSCWSGTRSALFAIGGACLTGLLVFPAMRQPRVLAALVVSGGLGALLSIAHMAPHEVYGLERILGSLVGGFDEVSSGRGGMWEASARAVLERPFFGYGESQFGVAVPEWEQYSHPHNIFLQVLLQWGLVGFACYFALAGLVAGRFLAAAPKRADALPAFLVAAALVIMSLVEGSLYHPYPIMMVAFAAAFVLARPESGHGPVVAGGAARART